MANHPPPEGIADDFFEQIFAYGGEPSTAATADSAEDGHGDGTDAEGGAFAVFPHNLLGLSLDQASSAAAGGGGFVKVEEGAAGSGGRFRDGVNKVEMAAPLPVASKAEPVGLFPSFGYAQELTIRPSPPHPQHFLGQPTSGAVPVVQQPPAPRPRVRARRGQATDPHSIAERLRRERIAERMRALQELVPNCNKTDRGAMLDEIVDYVKFLRFQVKILSMSRLGGAGAVAQLVSDVPLSSIEGVSNEKQHVWEKWSIDGTEHQVAKLMEEDVGAAMQFLQSKALCIMPISLVPPASYHTLHQPDASPPTKPESNTPSQC